MPGTTLQRLARPAVRRIAGPGALLVCLVAAIAVGTTSAGEAGTGSQSSPPGHRPSGSGTSGSGSSASGSSASGSAATATTGQSTTSPAGGHPGTDEPGIAMTVLPRRNGLLDVRQKVRVRQAVSSVQLAPPDLSAAGSRFTSQPPRLHRLTLTADGRHVPLNSTDVASARVIPLQSAATTFEVDYTVQDAVLSSRPSVSGRALAALRPMSLDGDGQLPVVVAVDGPSVLSVVCPELSGPQVTGCAAPDASGYQLSSPLPVSSALIVAQLDLDSAS